MNRILTFTVQSPCLRLDKFLVGQCPDLSRSRIQDLIAEGYVTLDSAPAKPASRLEIGQKVILTVPEPVSSRILPQDIPLNVVYQDGDILVVDKPAGLTVHPSPGHPDRTLVNAVLALCPDLQGIGGTIRPGIVHRLDKDTSGLMVVAKNQASHVDLSNQLKKRKFKKIYLALAHGNLLPKEAIVKSSLGRDPRNRKRMAVVSNGREAITKYRVVQYYENYSLIEIKTSTGRTHQIRVHFSSLGHSLVGDQIYGRADSLLDRHFLHATLLGFHLPSTKKYVEFTSQMPSELYDFLGTIEGFTGVEYIPQ